MLSIDFSSVQLASTKLRAYELSFCKVVIRRVHLICLFNQIKLQFFLFKKLAILLVTKDSVTRGDFTRRYLLVAANCLSHDAIKLLTIASLIGLAGSRVVCH